LKYLLLCNVFLVFGCHSPITNDSSTNNVVLNDGLSHLPALAGGYFPFVSKQTGRTYHIYIRLPEGYDVTDRETRYPIIYLTDGDSLFPMLASQHLFLHYDDKIPEAIIVGLAYGGFDPAINKRDVDYTEEGGAAAYQRFLANELMPLIEEKYHADPARRILFGQSHGGTFVLYSAYTRPDLFWGKVASNPSFAMGESFYEMPPRKGTQKESTLIIASGENDREILRAKALAWEKQMKRHNDLAWTMEFVTIPNGTHAADAPQAYRLAMGILFGR